MIIYIINSSIGLLSNIFCGLLVFELTKTGSINAKGIISSPLFWIVVAVIVINIIINVNLYRESKSLKSKIENSFFESLVKNTGIDKIVESLVEVYKTGNEAEFRKHIRMTSDLKKLLGVKK